MLLWGRGRPWRRMTEAGSNLEEIVFDVTEAVEGGYDAKAQGYGIFTQGQDWANLKYMVKDAVLCHFDDDTAPQSIRLSLLDQPELS